ncbi:MAG: Flp pilus assembly complex ATPase component TadA [Actinobacteria bacterium]|nr:Flp pilus assembly complex ATPase component TadA [Actinomycetota bacterium]
MNGKSLLNLSERLKEISVLDKGAIFEKSKKILFDLCVNGATREDLEKQKSEIKDRAVDILNIQAQKMLTVLSDEELEQMAQNMIDEVVGLGVIEKYLRDSSITDILVDGSALRISRNGENAVLAEEFGSAENVNYLIDRLLFFSGKSVTFKNPITEFKLHDGSRVCIVIPPASDVPHISIRRFNCLDLEIETLQRDGFMSHLQLEVIKDAIKEKMNVLVSGATGSGKTTMVNALLKKVNSSERIICIEDPPELYITQPNFVRLMAWHSSSEDIRDLGFRELVKTALRLNPDRIILGEVRGAEAFDLLRALNTGHRGSFTTIHANNPEDALYALETLVLMAESGLTLIAIKKLITRNINFILQVEKVYDSGLNIFTRKLGGLVFLRHTLSRDGEYRLEEVK